MTIEPHGGRLVDGIVRGAARAEMLDRATKEMKRLRLASQEIYDVELIATGAFSPLEGFMCREDYNSVVDTMRLENGTVWTIPIVLTASEKEAGNFKEGMDLALEDETGTVLAVLHLQEKFQYDKAKEALEVYGTSDDKHPGVNRLYNNGDVLLGGKISVLNRPKHNDFIKYRLDPADTREFFRKKGWRRVVGFQTRNPVHRAHEYIQKCALETVDAMLLHPLVGETKEGDIPAEIRMACYEVLLEKYYPKDRVALSVFPAAMRYAGPREAIFHALVRKNYGCSHFIVGRDHAGVGNYYGSFDAHYIFDEFDREDIGIVPLFFDYTFYCRSCYGMASFKTCPHDSKRHVALSGTEVRRILAEGHAPPSSFTRPEIAKILSAYYRCESEYHKQPS
ncbi:MAG: sulfate adenylyltransferase [Candidatus Brocadiales bacterium]|nr:sulfate adenylyltransferase [Candidatus Bathyanammoxibius amoris]